MKRIIFMEIILLLTHVTQYFNMCQKQQNNVSLRGDPIHRDDAAICRNRYNFIIVQLFNRLPRRCPAATGLPPRNDG